MALETITAQATPQTGTQTVYTVPAGKTARIIQASFANAAVPAGPLELTLQWTDVSEAPAVTTNLVSALRVLADETLSPIKQGLVLSAGDSLRVIPSAGQVDVILGVDEATETTVTNAYRISSTTDTNLAGADDTGYSVPFLLLVNSGSDIEYANLHLNDTSVPEVYELCHRLPVVPGVMYYPLVGELGLGIGDRLRARSSGADLTAVVSYVPQTNLRTFGYRLQAATYTTIATASGGTQRMTYLGFCNTGSAAEDLSVMLLDSSASNRQVRWIYEVTVPPGMTAFPLSGDLTLNVGDQLRAKGGGTTSAITAVVCLEA